MEGLGCQEHLNHALMEFRSPTNSLFLVFASSAWLQAECVFMLLIPMAQSMFGAHWMERLWAQATVISLGLEAVQQFHSSWRCLHQREVSVAVDCMPPL